MKRFVASVLAAVLAVFIAVSSTGCAVLVAPVESVAVAAGPPARGSEGQKANPVLAAAINGFGIGLLKKVKPGGSGNVVVSPLSVHAALAMTSQGASGTTDEEMRSVLFPEGPTGHMEQAKRYADLLSNLPGSEEITLTVANALWAQKGVAFEQPFLDADRNYFGAQIATLDLHAPGAPATMNAWAREHTNGLIDSIVTGVPAEAILYLANAAYFKGKWAHELKPEATKPGTFHLADGTAIEVPMMHGGKGIAATETALFKAAKLPFGFPGPDGVSAWVFVPAEGEDLAALESSLTAENWERWTSSATTREAVVTLPKFKVDWGGSMSESLKGMGMPRAFDPNRADLTGITRDPKLLGPAYISDVSHKTVLDVNETGVEAAATTVVAVSAGAVATARQPPLQVVADRPFLFAITDDVNGEILFLGKIADPR